MADVNISSYAKSKNQSSGSSTTTVTNITTKTVSATEADKLKESHTFWGNTFNGTQDVEGDLTIRRNHKLNVTGDASVTSYTRSGSYVLFQGTKYIDQNSDLNISKTDVNLTDSDTFYNFTENGNSVTLDKDGIYLKGSNSLHTNNINVDVIDSENADTIYVEKPLKLAQGLDLSNQKLTVDTIYSNHIQNTADIKTLDLTVFGTMNVFNMTIGQIESVKGTIILSPANFKIDAITDGSTYTAGADVPNYYVTDGESDVYTTKRLYQICYDESTDKYINNDWIPGDHVFCHEFNVTDNNKHYWTAVIGTASKVSVTVNGHPQLCNMIEVIDSVTTTGNLVTTLPNGGMSVGDELACLGSKNVNRRNAIMIASTLSYDEQVDAPCIVQYTDIDGYSLLNKQYSYLSKSGNVLRGSLLAENGVNYQDYINQTLNQKLYVHIAYAINQTGSVDSWCKAKDMNDDTVYYFIGYATNTDVSDDDLVYSDYLWSEYNTQQNESQHCLLPVTERLILNADGDLYVDVAYDKRCILATDTLEFTAYTLESQAEAITAFTDDTDNNCYRLQMMLQEDWSLKSAEEQFISARVVLYDMNGNKIDADQFNVTMDNNAILSVTDVISTTVSDASNRISHLEQTSSSFDLRLQNVEAGQGQDQTEIISAIAGIHTDISNIDSSITTIKSQYNYVTDQFTELSDQFADISAGIAKIDLTAGERTYGGENILDGTNFGNQALDVSNYFDVWNSVNIQNSKSLNTDYGELVYNGSNVTKSSDYTEVCRQNLSGRLKPETYYTLSFYAYNGTKCTTYVYPSVGDTAVNQFVFGKSSGFCASDCNNTWNIESDGWTKCYQTFKTTASISSEADYYFLIRSYANETTYNNLRITQLKLEEGQVPTAYGISAHDWQGTISLQPDQILLNIRDGLKNTGIDIESGKIELNADNTTVNGTLNVSEDGAGLIFLDDDNEAVINIQKKALDSLDNIERDSYSSFSQHQLFYQFDTKIPELTYTINIGSVTSGETINLYTKNNYNKFYLYPLVYGTYGSTSDYPDNPTMTFTVTFRVLVDSTAIYSKTQTHTFTMNSQGNYDSDNLLLDVDSDIAITASGSAQLQVYVTQTESQHFLAVNSIISDGLSGSYKLRMTCTVGCNKHVKTNTTRLGTDGIYISQAANNQYMYFGPQGFQTIWKDGTNKTKGLALKDSNGVQMLYGLNEQTASTNKQVWGTISTITPNVETHRYNGYGSVWESPYWVCRPTANDSVIVVTGDYSSCSGFVVQLPMTYTSTDGSYSCAVPPGKVYYIKNDIDGGKLILQTTPNARICMNGVQQIATKASAWQTFNSGGYEFLECVFDGVYWNVKK